MKNSLNNIKSTLATAYDFCEQGFSLMNKKNFKDTIGCCNNAIKINTNYRVAYLLKDFAYYGIKKN